MAQELSRYWFNGRVDVGKECYKSNPSVPLTDHQKETVAQVELASGKLRTGAKDTVKWAKMLAPQAFQGKPEADHDAIAAKVQKSVGTMREAAMNRAINLDPEGGKMAEHVRIAKERIAEGKPVVIFAHNLEAIGHIQAAMEKAGIKSVGLTGKDSSKDKASKAAQFQQGHADVIVMSDAGATGLNLQRGKCIIHHDIPATAMVHNQRTARIHRLGQTDNVESITLQADHPWEANNMERIKRKGVLGEIFQDPNGFLDDTGLAGDLKAVRARAGQVKSAA
jgi:SNF2 family DNA or RNA helicase